MIGTLVQVAKEMARYEGDICRWDEDRVVLHRLCESASKGGDITKVKVAVLDLTDHSVHLEDYKEEERYKYLYALSTGKHAIGPSWLLDFRKRKTDKKSREEIIRTGIKEIRASIKSLEEKQWDSLAGKLGDITKNESLVLLTIRRDGKLPGEIKDFLDEFINKKVLGERRAASKGEGHCAICGERREVRSAIPFRFFTIEKQGFSPMGREDQVWKYAPICEECAKWLYVAESYLEENLRTRVAGKAAYLVPDLEPGAADIKGSFIHFLWRWREHTKDKVVPDENFPEVGDSEKDDAHLNLFEGLIEESDLGLKDQPPFRSASLVFYQPGQKFLFLYTISEILPTHLREAKRRLAKLRELLSRGALGELGTRLVPRLKADFGFVGQAWRWPHKGQTESQGALKITPMRLVEAVLTERLPREREFWLDVDDLLRATYLEVIGSKDQKQTLQRAIAQRIGRIWAIWALIYGSNKLRGGESMATPTMPQEGEREPTREIGEEFWEEFFRPRMLLDSPPTRAAFLIGVLFGLVEHKQRSERDAKSGEMPIVSRLRGLTVSKEEIVGRLFPELMLKLRQLDGNTPAAQAIQQAASDYASRGGDISDEEARFCFCLGWALSWTTVRDIGEALPPGKGGKEEEVSSEEETASKL